MALECSAQALAVQANQRLIAIRKIRLDAAERALSGLLCAEHSFCVELIAIKTRQDAVEYISHNRKQLPDLILLDASLPDGSGFDLCRQIRERYSRSKVCMVALSIRTSHGLWHML
eukprot:scaffold1637_cov17-Tisochrysis_lutea.AAC.1